MRHGYAHKVDANQAAIVAAFERMGCIVIDLSGVGNGCADILVQHGFAMIAVEIKDGEKVPSARRLTDAQEKLHARMTIRICLDIDDVLRLGRELRQMNADICQARQQRIKEVSCKS